MSGPPVLPQAHEGQPERAGLLRLGARKPKALDLFCGAGGATRGLQLAGFHVTGVDIEPQPRYVGDEFHQADALEFPLEGYDFIWASPVCKRYSLMSIVREGLSESHPDQIPAVRERLKNSGRQYTIENVNCSPLLRGSQMLCGQMFDLGVIRHRWFESSFGYLTPYHLKPHKPGHLCIVGHGGPANQRRWKIAAAREAMGIDWMSRDEIVEAIPPAYSEFIGRQVLPLVATL